MDGRITNKHIKNMDVTIAIAGKGIFYIALTDNPFVVVSKPSPNEIACIIIFIFAAARGEGESSKHCCCD